jgi:putative FmdB family regulatory protein
MPLYEYQCDACGHRFEKIQKFSDPLETICPVCGGVVRKLMSSPAIQFKGSGFYITDYPKKDQSGTDKSEGGSADKSAKTESGSSKTDKTETATAPTSSDKNATAKSAPASSESSSSSAKDSSSSRSSKSGT